MTDDTWDVMDDTRNPFENEIDNEPDPCIDDPTDWDREQRYLWWSTRPVM